MHMNDYAREGGIDFSRNKKATSQLNVVIIMQSAMLLVVILDSGVFSLFFLIIQTFFSGVGVNAVYNLYPGI